MWSKVEKYVKEHNLLNNNDLYIVALSGGADSVALLLWMKETGYHIHAAHCNFHLRGAESDRDELFCKELCDRLDIPLHLAHFDTRTYAELHKVSIEMAARELRYGWFRQLVNVEEAFLCVAHHRDDSVETVLLNLVRGTGLRGLTGIQPRNGYVLRPFLSVSRVEIEAFLAEKGQKYVTDSTNLEADVQRNKIRLQVLPLLQELNPAVVDNIQRTAENLQSAQLVLDGVVDKFKLSNILELSEFCSNSLSEYIAFEWLKPYGFNGSQVRQILSAETGGMVHSERGYDVLKDRDRLIVEPSLEPLKPMRIPEEGTYVLGEKARFSVCKKPVCVSKEAHVATFDAAKVHFPLTVRRVEDGDWMVPFGMKGRKLMSDLMTDLKMTLFEKRRQLVVVDSQGVVIWAVGLRVADSVAVSDTTCEVLELSFRESVL